MIKGILLGSSSALALSALLISAVTLVVPPPQPGARPVAAVPVAPVQRDRAESLPRVPEPPMSPVAAAVATATPSRPALPTEQMVPPLPVEPIAAPEREEQASVSEAPSPVEPVEPPRSDVATAVDVPATSEFNRPPEDGVAVTPTFEQRPRPAAVAEGLRLGEAPPEAVTADTRSASRPRPSFVTGLGEGPEAGDAPAIPRALSREAAPETFGSLVAGQGEAPAAASPSAETLEVSGAGGTASEERAVDAEVSGASETGVVASQGPSGQVASAPSQLPDTITPQQSPAPATDRISVVENPVVPPRSEAPEVQDAEPVMPRRLVLDSERGEGGAFGEGTETTSEAGALEAFGAPFSNPQGLPLMAVVLLDDPSFDVDRSDLLALDFPVTFAIDPMRNDAGSVAAEYRAAGHEVIALADIFPSGAAPQDIEIAMSAMHRAMPQAIGILDRASDGIVRDRTVLEALLPSLQEAGMGLLAHPEGLNSGVESARRQGVPATTLYRVLDEKGERAALIERFLNRATFEAAQNGATVVVGTATGETVSAIRAWRQNNRAAQVVAAPLSAVLLNLDTEN